MYLDAAVRRENRSLYLSIVAGQMAWADGEATKRIAKDLLGD